MQACDRHAEHENSIKVGRFQMQVRDLMAPTEDRMTGADVVLTKEMCDRCLEEFRAWWSATAPVTLYVMPDLGPEEVVPSLVRLDGIEPEVEPEEEG